MKDGMPQATAKPTCASNTSMSHDESHLPITSSIEPTWAAEARACYRDVIQTLQRAAVPFVVGGGFAFHRHTGIWRTTKDLDLFLVADSVPEAMDALAADGFEVYVEDPVWLAKARRDGLFVDLITGVGNATLPVEESWILNSDEGEILGISCRVLGAEEMIASKMFVTRRERFDGADIAHLVRARGERLDWDRVLRLTEPHWQMLYWHLVLFAFIYPAHTTLVPAPVWRQFAKSFESDVLHSEQDAPFRGSLVDPRMFAIDVSEWGERDLYEELAASYPRKLADRPRSKE